MDGMGVIEVQNFDMILEKRLFAEIMLDHLLYFTEDTLRFTLQYNGFTVCQIRPVWDEYILQAMVVKRNDLQLSPFVEQQAILKRALDEYISKHGRVAIYGASHEALAYIAMLQPRVEFIVDDSPMKQGKYSPVGGLRILDPMALNYRIPIMRDISPFIRSEFDADDVSNATEITDPPDAVIIMGAGYSDEIAKTLEFDGSVAIMRDWGVEVIK
jgi:hypothetical protein